MIDGAGKYVTSRTDFGWSAFARERFGIECGATRENDSIGWDLGTGPD
jgi:hypothetical protein